MTLPRPPSDGGSILQWAEEVQDMLRALQPRASATVSPSSSPTGTTWEARIATTPPDEIAPLPFEGRYGGKDASDQAILLVKIGTIQGIEPTVVGGESSPPAGWWKFFIAPLTTKYLEAQVTLDADGTVSAQQVSLVTTPTATPDGNSATGAAPVNAYRSLLKVVVDSSYIAAITQYTSGAQQCIVYTTDAGCTTETKRAAWLP